MVRQLSLLIALAAVISCFPLEQAASAQSIEPRNEFNVGFSYLTDFEFGGSGFTVGYAQKAKSWFEVEVQFDANFNLGGTTFDQYTIGSGPKFMLPGKRLTPFVHMLLGASNFRAFNSTGSEFAIKYGAGVDVSLNHQWSARFELNDLVVWNPATHNLQVNTGLVVRF